MPHHHKIVRPQKTKPERPLKLRKDIAIVLAALGYRRATVHTLHCNGFYSVPLDSVITVYRLTTKEQIVAIALRDYAKVLGNQIQHAIGDTEFFDKLCVSFGVPVNKFWARSCRKSNKK